MLQIIKYWCSGVAAAISAGFGAPLAGLIYAREVVLRHQSLASFSPILYLHNFIFFTVEVFNYEPTFDIPNVTGNSPINIVIIIFAEFLLVFWRVYTHTF